MISVHNISKSFLIPHEQKRSVKGSLFSLFNTKYYERIEVLKDFSLRIGQINTAAHFGGGV